MCAGIALLFSQFTGQFVLRIKRIPTGAYRPRERAMFNSSVSFGKGKQPCRENLHALWRRFSCPLM